MRALAITNPNATSMSPRTRDVIVRALGSELKIDAVETTARGHAADLAAQARADGFDLVIAVGGDGTVNEVVNGLMRAGADPSAPRLAVVPSGSANVFARALGMPSQPVEATGWVIERLRQGQQRRISLGVLHADLITLGAQVRSEQRWFTFCAGLGWDAEVIHAIEHRREAGARATPRLYFRTALQEFLRTDRRHPALTLEYARVDVAGAPTPSTDAAERLLWVVVTNTTPWTYLGERPLQPTPQASFDTGLDVFAARRLGSVRTARLLRRLLRDAPINDDTVLSLHDEERLKVRARRPVAIQIDGDYLGECLTADLANVPEALAVVC